MELLPPLTNSYRSSTISGEIKRISTPAQTNLGSVKNNIWVKVKGLLLQCNSFHTKVYKTGMCKKQTSRPCWLLWFQQMIQSWVHLDLLYHHMYNQDCILKFYLTGTIQWGLLKLLVQLPDLKFNTQSVDQKDNSWKNHQTRLLFSHSWAIALKSRVQVFWTEPPPPK